MNLRHDITHSLNCHSYNRSLGFLYIMLGPYKNRDNRKGRSGTIHEWFAWHQVKNNLKSYSNIFSEYKLCCYQLNQDHCMNQPQNSKTIWPESPDYPVTLVTMDYSLLHTHSTKVPFLTKVFLPELFHFCLSFSPILQCPIYILSPHEAFIIVFSSQINLSLLCISFSPSNLCPHSVIITQHLLYAKH